METLRVVAARQHNLKRLSCELPRQRLVVVTGPSGSGKSSLAFDTIYAEGQRRYMESLSMRARQWLEQLPRPLVDAVEGLSPAIAVDQRGLASNPRATVGTVTEISDFLRVLFATIGVAHCPRSGRPLKAYSAEEIANLLLELPDGTRFVLLSPLGRKVPGNLEDEVQRMSGEGYSRARIDGAYVELGTPPRFDASTTHEVCVVIDRLVAGKTTRQRLTDSVEHALFRGRGTLLVDCLDEQPAMVLSDRLISWGYDIELPPLEPKLFSFNSPAGACPDCKGLGALETPNDDAESAGSLRRGRAELPACPTCQGSRLRSEAKLVRVLGRTYPELTSLSLDELTVALDGIRHGLSTAERKLAEPLLEPVSARLGFLAKLGLPYLTLDRAAGSLSDGEQRRIRLAAQLAGQLVGILYVLDEPSVGLHPRDTEALTLALRALVDRGNSVLVVEHDLAIVRSADYVLELGPGAGDAGGNLVHSGSVDTLLSNAASPTGQFLARRRALPRSKKRGPYLRFIEVQQAKAHNLKGGVARFPLGTLTVVTGVSGSGKTSLVVDTLWRAAHQHTERLPFDAAVVLGLDGIDKVIGVDQSGIGRSGRSNPATFSGLFTEIRDLFAGLPEARARGYKSGRFSFNVKGGRCEKCQGDGVVDVDMHFLPDVSVPCDACKGHRYNRETLEVRYRGKHIAEVLEMTVDEASEQLAAIPKASRILAPLRQLGLGYLRLGQPAGTLSGGEAQRLKLATELARPAAGHTLYVLDEPTSGLHLSDVELLLHALYALRDAGHTVVVIEHQTEFIACADWVIDLGPEGGRNGGQVVAMGTPEDVARHPQSHTARFLRAVFEEPG
jgi:excinuclease ABC subunit A